MAEDAGDIILPKHLGIILDGNRRFAIQLMKKPWEGHKMGLLKAREVLDWATDAGIKYITAYTLSLENLNSRPRQELEFILDQMRKECDEVLNNENHVINRKKICVRVIGRKHLLPHDLQERFRAVEKKTSGYDNYYLNLAVAYGGQQEITDAVQKIAKRIIEGKIKIRDIDEELVREALYTNGQPMPDLIIRTGGEHRLSNFLPFQSAYSELYFTDKKWPELTKQDFDDALKDFSNRQRRFGR